MFKENSKAIYLQIGDRICNDILVGDLAAGTRLPSVREYAVQMQVNPNTVMRTYETLANQGVIYNRRGIGFFVADDAVDVIRDTNAREFLDHELPDVFAQLNVLGISVDELAARYGDFLNK